MKSSEKFYWTGIFTLIFAILGIILSISGQVTVQTEATTYTGEQIVNFYLMHYQTIGTIISLTLLIISFIMFGFSGVIRAIEKMHTDNN
ncbi:MAG: hypothetical protein E2598_07485 [Sphingobium sp.]|nr:hypothetical protein [Sphingobium sp.]